MPKLLVLSGLSMLGALPSDGLASWRTDRKGRPFVEETKRTTRLMKKPSERLDSSLVGRLLVAPRRSPAYLEACASSSMPSVDFNVSHTDGAVVAAISIFGRVGVDIECRRGGRVEEYLAAFTERERAWILAGASAEERMLRLWTRKEAILKAAGTGFLIPPSSIDVLEGEALVGGARYCALELRICGKGEFFCHLASQVARSPEDKLFGQAEGPARTFAPSEMSQLFFSGEELSRELFGAGGNTADLEKRRSEGNFPSLLRRDR